MEGLEGADIVMMLRLQRERMEGSYVPSTREYFHFFGLDHEKLARAKPDALIMHPGPMNRGVEIASTVADHSRSVIREQVEMGVAVRMAVLEALAAQLPNTAETSPRCARTPHAGTSATATAFINARLIDPARATRRAGRPAGQGRRHRRSRRRICGAMRPTAPRSSTARATCCAPA